MRWRGLATLARSRGFPRDQFSGPWLFSTAEARTSNSSSSARSRGLINSSSSKFPLCLRGCAAACRGVLCCPRATSNLEHNRAMRRCARRSRKSRNIANFPVRGIAIRDSRSLLSLWSEQTTHFVVVHGVSEERASRCAPCLSPRFANFRLHRARRRSRLCTMISLTGACSDRVVRYRCSLRLASACCSDASRVT